MCGMILICGNIALINSFIGVCMQNYANEVQNQAREVTDLKRQVGQMAEFFNSE